MFFYQSIFYASYKSDNLTMIRVSGLMFDSGGVKSVECHYGRALDVYALNEIL